MWNLAQVKLVYKETIKSPVVGVGHYEPLRHYAEVHLKMEPLEAGSGLVFDTDCSEDVLDRNWQRLILTHLQEKRASGCSYGGSDYRYEDNDCGRKSAFEAYRGRRF